VVDIRSDLAGVGLEVAIGVPERDVRDGVNDHLAQPLAAWPVERPLVASDRGIAELRRVSG
jgi:hypothetical protein